ncbi:MAG: ABC transporter substrate-binding protein [Actinomycetota bacterium]
MSNRSGRLGLRDKVFLGALALALLVNLWMVDSLRDEVAKLRKAQGTGPVTEALAEPSAQVTEDSAAAPAGEAASSADRTSLPVAQPPGGSQAGVSKAAIKIGTVVTQTGLVDMSPIVRGLSAWVQHVNAEGGVNGRRIELVVEDDGTDTSRGSAAIRKLVENDKVFALVGECAPLSDVQNIEYLKQKGVPVIGSCILPTDQFKTNRYQFALRPSPDTEGRITGKYAAKDMGAKKPAVIVLDQQLMVEMGNGTVAQWKAMGVKDYVVETVAATNPNFTPTVVRLRSQGVDNVTLLLDSASTIRFLQAAAQQGWKPPMLSISSYDEEVNRYAGEQAEGTVVPGFTEYLVTNGPQQRQFRADMQRFYPQGGVRLELATGGYHPAQVFTDVLGKLGDDVTRERFINGMESLTNYDDGWEPPYTLRSGNHETARAAKFAVVKEGRVVPITGQWYYL